MTSDAVDTHRSHVAVSNSLLLHNRRHLLPTLPHGRARVTNIMEDYAAKAVNTTTVSADTKDEYCGPPSPYCTSCQRCPSFARPHMVPSPLDPRHCTLKRVTLTLDLEHHRSTRESRSPPSLTPPPAVYSHLMAVTKVTNILPCDRDVSKHIHSDLPPISCLRSDVD